MHGPPINWEWSTELVEIKQAIHKFFSNKFHEKWLVRPKLVNEEFQILLDDQREFLDSPISLEEIRQAV